MKHTELCLGRYQHYKNKQYYEVLGIARHSETGEDLVVYKALYESLEFGLNQLWVRPLSLFLGLVYEDGIRIQRFRFVEE